MTQMNAELVELSIATGSVITMELRSLLSSIDG